MAKKTFSSLEFKYRAYKYRFKDDKLELNYILGNVKEGNTVLDIGAHKGGYLYWLRKQAGDKGQVVAFEPQPILYDYLCQAVDKLGYTNVELHNAGVSSSNGKMQLFVPKATGLTSPGATFEHRDNSDQGHFQEIPVLQLDTLFKNARRKIDFVKMDVEGHELDAFKGAADLLKAHRPKVIFECENRHLNGVKVEDVFAYLQNLDYQGYYFWNGQLCGIDSFDSSLHQQITEDSRIVDKKKYANNFVFEPN